MPCLVRGRPDFSVKSWLSSTQPQVPRADDLVKLLGELLTKTIRHEVA